MQLWKLYLKHTRLADIYNTGIYLAGGGSMLRGLKRTTKDLPVYIAEDPLRAVVRGTGMALKHYKFKSILIK
jgi:rod shape-determining protein MreB